MTLCLWMLSMLFVLRDLHQSGEASICFVIEISMVKHNTLIIHRYINMLIDCSNLFEFRDRYQSGEASICFVTDIKYGETSILDHP